MNLITLLTECYLTEGYPEAQRDFSLTASPEDVATAIAAYKDLVNRNQVYGNERNIDYWRKQGWELFAEFVTAKSQQKSKTQAKRSKAPGKSIVLEETPEWLIVIPLNKDASCYHGKNTDWCTAKPNASHFEKYFYDADVVLIYFLQIQTSKKWAIACHNNTEEIELFDQNDTTINEFEFKTQTKLDPTKYRLAALATRSDPRFIDTKAHFHNMEEIIAAAKPYDKVDSEVERALLFVKNLNEIVSYCMTVKGRWPEAEKLILRDAQSALDYAKGVITGPWPEAEPMFINNALYATIYARDVLHTRWIEAEPRLLELLPSDLSPLYYAALVMQTRWLEAERIIEQQRDDPILMRTLRRVASKYLEKFPQWKINTPDETLENNLTLVFDSGKRAIETEKLPVYKLRRLFDTKPSARTGKAFPPAQIEEAIDYGTSTAEGYNCIVSLTNVKDGVIKFRTECSHIQVRNFYTLYDDDCTYLVALYL